MHRHVIFRHFCVYNVSHTSCLLLPLLHYCLSPPYPTAIFMSYVYIYIYIHPHIYMYYISMYTCISEAWENIQHLSKSQLPHILWQSLDFILYGWIKLYCVYIHHIFCIQSPVEGPLCWFCNLPIVGSATVTLEVQVYLWCVDCESFGCMSMYGKLSHSVALFILKDICEFL